MKPFGHGTSEAWQRRAARDEACATGPGIRIGVMTTWEYMTAPIMIHATKQILDNFG